MSPYSASVIYYRRQRGTRDLQRVVETAHYRTKKQATREVAERAGRTAGSYEEGNAFTFNVHTSVRKVDFAPETFIPARTTQERTPAVKDSRGRWHDRSGHLVSEGEAHRRNKISRSLRRHHAQRRQARRKARRRYGQWGESSVAMPPDESPPSIEEGEAYSP